MKYIFSLLFFFSILFIRLFVCSLLIYLFIHFFLWFLECLEDVLQIVDFERVVQLRTQVPPIPQMHPFNNTNTPLNEDLPTSLNPAENNILDLSLLSGDLDDPDAKSEIVQDILKRLSTMSIHYVVGVSGCGKTKALLDISREYFVLLFTFDSLYASDVEQSFAECQRSFQGKSTEEYGVYSSICEAAIATMILQRVLALLLIRLTYPQLTPWQWTLFQLQFNIPDTGPNEFLRLITKCVDMEAVKSLKNPITPLYDLISKVKKITTEQGKGIVLAVDEAQVLLKTGSNKFPRITEPTQFERPFYSFFMNQISRLGRPILIAGSALSLSELELYQSVFSKIEGTPIIKHQNFRYAL
jgi:hypothetical protein